MFRTIAVNSGEKISIRDNWLVVQNDNEEKRIPIDDIYSVLVDNQQCNMTVASINRLSNNGTHIIFCDEKHNPSSIILPYSIHYRPLNVVKKQIMMSDLFKDALWDKIVSSKIRNQAKVLELCNKTPARIKRIYELSTEVCNGDEGNREGIAAKLFFKEMYGSEFIRMNDDGINHALNYGYSIIRSAVCKTLVSYGYYCVIGIHHINELNPFNLADDLMEPLRPVIDMWVDDNASEILDKLSREQRNELASITNQTIEWNNKIMKIRNAIDKYVSSFTSATERQSSKLLVCPEIIRGNIFDVDD